MRTTAVAVFLIALSANAMVSSTVCNIPGPPADASPAIVACLNTYQDVEMVGFFQINTSINMPQGTRLTSRGGTFNSGLTAGPTLNGYVIVLDSNVSTTVERQQIIIPATSTAAGGIIVRNTIGNAQFNMIRENYIEDQGNGARATIGIRIQSNGPYQVAFNTLNHNTVFRFRYAFYLGSDNGNTYPATANRLDGNRTSATYNLFLDRGTQQSTITAHFCNGNSYATTASTCLLMGNPLLPGLTHENRIEIHSDVTGGFGIQGTPYLLYNSATKNHIDVFSGDGQGTPAAPLTNGMPATIGNSNTITFH